ncbi:DNA-binding NarL/FixJ family response regulator [Variovorax sp. TBS-050B]|uniref:response regulator transcription factor n=1 Tax=Variovorax sp. TBS-050B TaxID=2940551 RepID=UPI0024766384|nr:response regulator transcription factor [Variovorax sp. TBS-050B]MDH6590638.1 DNA-binding NarL/FixJ family response regulator [Variovorax sp. TBS-050B]
MSTTAEPSPRPSQAAPRIRVLIADDQALIRRGMAMLLDAAPDIEVVGQAADGVEAVELARRLLPDVVLMDLHMPRKGGVLATREISAALPHTRVMVLTTFDRDDLVFDAVRAGAQAYLLKDASEEEVLDTVRAVQRGESRLTPQIARKVMDQFRLLADRVAQEPSAPPLPDARAGTQPAATELPPASVDATKPLTEREAAVLDLIAKGYGNRQIATALNLAEGTAKNHVSRIMQKLHANTRTELAVRVLAKKD